MPIHYGSQIKEHEIVRNTCGIFDVSHMTILDFSGDQSKSFLRRLLSNDIEKLKENSDGLYSAMLNDMGYVLDDLIVYKMEFGYRLIVNCATRDKDMSWINENLINWDVSMKERPDLSILSVQGPKTDEVLSRIKNDLFITGLNKRPFSGTCMDQTLVTRTGYTGEKGVEIVLSEEEARILWEELLSAGAYPIGLGARDTLRLEAGFNLYGNEMDETISPLECNMDWTVDLEDINRNFIGKSSYIDKKKQASHSIQKGLIFEEKIIVRPGQNIHFEENGSYQGTVTSGSYSPTLKKPIALARMSMNNNDYCYAQVRGKKIRAKITKPKFLNL